MKPNPTSDPKKKPINNKVSSKDVAKLAGVSQSTVSRVLNKVSSSLISEETRKRVMQAARQLGYSPNPLARALRGNKSHLLGVIVRDVSDPFFSFFVARLITQARERNYHIVLGHAGSEPKEALEFTDILDARHTDGIFLLGDLRGDELALQELLRFNHALIALCRGPSPASIYTINADNFAGARILLDHLCQLGHTKIGFLDGEWLGDIRERRETYKEYLKEKNLPNRPEWIQTERNDWAGGYQAMGRILALEDPPTAIFASDDSMALGAIKAATDAGLQIPSQLSIVGFDNIDASRFSTPSLTTMSQPVDKMVHKALDLMIQLIDEPEKAPSRKIMRLKPEFILRESTGVVPNR